MNFYSKLYEVLREESSLYEELLNLSKEKRDILLNKKTEELPPITRKEGTTMEEISKLEDERVKLLHELSKTNEIPFERLNVDKIIEIAPEEVAKRLTHLRTSFKSTLEELQRLNELNEGMITESLSYIKFTLDTIRSAVESQQSTYGGRGKRKVGVPILINREA